METEWRVVAEFPNYSVSNTGQVRNDHTGRLMTRHVNQFGIVNVSFNRNDSQTKRSVSILVANAFVKREREEFDTPIHLNGERLNNNAQNLMWRPRWFAIKFHQQFQQDAPCYSVPIQDRRTEEVYETSWHAVVKHGILDREIAMSVMTRMPCFPTYQVFRRVS